MHFYPQALGGGTVGLTDGLFFLILLHTTNFLMQTTIVDSVCVCEGGYCTADHGSCADKVFLFQAILVMFVFF